MPATKKRTVRIVCSKGSCRRLFDESTAQLISFVGEVKKKEVDVNFQVCPRCFEKQYKIFKHDTQSRRMEIPVRKEYNIKRGVE